MVINGQDFEERSNYAQGLISEISKMIENINNKNHISGQFFSDVHKKIQKAKSLQINVEKYETELKYFRCNLLKRKINDKLDQIQKNYKEKYFDMNLLEYQDIENNFLELKKDFSDIPEIENLYYELKIFIKKAQIYRKLSGLSDQESCYDLDQVLSEVLNLKDAGIDVGDLEDLIYGE